MSQCQHEFGVARCKFCGAAKPKPFTIYSSPVPFGPWRPAEPFVPEFCDGTEGEWFTVNVVRDLISHPEYGPAFPASALGELRRQRDETTVTYASPDGFVYESRTIHQEAERKFTARAPMGLLDPDFLDMNMSMVEYESDEWDWVESRGTRRVSEFHDLLAHMDEIADEVGEDGEVRRPFRWNRAKDPDTGTWSDQYWSRSELAERLARYAWNEDYFTKRRIPVEVWAGRILVDGTGRFVYLGDGVFATVIVKWFDRFDANGEPVWKFTVFWRESQGFAPPTPDGRKYRAWTYHYAKTFTSERGGTDMAGFHREGAVGFAQRLEAKARLEAELILADRQSMGEFAEPEWDRDEFPYDPSSLAFLGNQSWSDEYAE